MVSTKFLLLLKRDEWIGNRRIKITIIGMTHMDPILVDKRLRRMTITTDDDDDKFHYHL